MIMQSKKNYYAIDIMKFIASIFVVYMHTTPFIAYDENTDYLLFSIARMAVPIFFTISGYLFFKKVNQNSADRNVLIKYLKRILLLYLIWSVLYLIFNLIQQNTINITIILNYIKDFVLLGTYFQLWYFPALILAIALVFFMYKKLSLYNILIISLCIYLIGLLGNSYKIILGDNLLINSILNKYLLMFKTTRNGLFYGTLFVAIGLFISKHESKLSIRKKTILLILSLLALIAESFILKSLGVQRNFDMCVMQIPVVYFLINLLISINLQDKNIYIFFRKCSILIFGVHKIFIELFQRAFSQTNLISIINKNFIIFILTILCSIIFSIIILKLEKNIKFKSLKYLH